MSYKGSVRSARGRLVVLAAFAWPGAWLSGCGGSPPAVLGPSDAPEAVDAPLVSTQPGAWFDGDGSLSVVSAGRRLRLVLSAPIASCNAAFDSDSRGVELVQKASLPFQVLADACRQDHPTILLREESATASPTELERSYHDVARCAALDFSTSVAWVPSAIAAADPCPVALGLGWRLPTVAELEGLGTDERKAIAGALLDMEERGGFGSLLLYARDRSGTLRLVSVSPNAGEPAPALDAQQREKPLATAALRCVRESQPPAGAARPLPPPLPEAAACLRALRAEQTSLKSATPKTPLELERLEARVKQLTESPAPLATEQVQRELLQLLSAPAIETLAREARDERALTERYAELAESLDAPGISASERERRRAEFDTLRKRLSGQIAQSAIASSAGRRQLATLLARLQALLENVEQAKKASKKGKRAVADPTTLVRRVRELQGTRAAATSPGPAAHQP